MPHYNFNDQLPHGRLLRRYLSGLETLLKDGPDALAVMTAMLSGPENEEASYVEIMTRFGFESTSKAMTAYTTIKQLSVSANTTPEVAALLAYLRTLIAEFR